MTPGDPYADMLRRALHAEADQVMPSPDALSRIRARTTRTRPGLNWAWLNGGWKGPLLASAAAVLMAGVAISATPAAIDRITTAGDNSRAEQEAARRKTAPALPTQPGMVIVGPDGTTTFPAGSAQLACIPVKPRAKARKTPTPFVTPTLITPTPRATTSCPPSTVPTIIPTPSVPTVTPTPTQTVKPTVTPTAPQTQEPSPTDTAQPTVTSSPEEPSPTAPAPATTPS